MTTHESDGNDSDGVACPTCGDTFSTDHGVKVHHKSVHGESLAKKELECDWCGESFTRYESNIRPDRNYCSRVCEGQRRSEELTGEDAPNWQGGNVEKTCAWCGATVEIKPARDGGSDHYFCSPRCKGDWMSENVVGENHPNWTRTEVKCATCGKTKTVCSAIAKKYDNHFCDLECRGEYWSENYTGEDSWRWKGGEENYGAGWNREKKEKVRERDNRECQHCGRSEKEHLEVFGTKHAVHHINPARCFDDAERRNRMENLITLCRGECHRTWEQMAPLRPT